MFWSEIKVLLTIYEDVEFDQSPCWIFFKGGSLGLWVKLSNFFKVGICSKKDLEMMFLDVLE